MANHHRGNEDHTPPVLRVVDFSGHDRIRERSPGRINEKVARKIEDDVRRLSTQNHLAVSRRIDELDHEWDLDRATMAAFALAGGVAVGIGISRKSPRFFLPLAGQLAFLALHAAQGWSPPAFVLRLLGFRSRSEIDAEKYALKSMRGDFTQRLD